MSIILHNGREEWLKVGDNDSKSVIETALQISNGIPLHDFDEINSKDANVAALVSILADIIQATCVVPAAVPTTLASAA